MTLLLLACTGPTPAPSAQDLPEAVSKVPHASWPDGVVPQTAPFSLVAEPSQDVVDSVTVHGWTDSGLAWELHHPGMGGASCDMWAQLQVVGPASSVGVERFEHAFVEGDECDGPSPGQALERARAGWLSEQGARMGGVGLGGTALVVSGESLEPMTYEAKAGYTLMLAGQTVEREPADFVWDWRLVEVFWHPDGVMAAALVAGTGMGFEGSYTRYEVQVLPLLPDAALE